jgi:hypothetical protein
MPKHSLSFAVVALLVLAPSAYAGERTPVTSLARAPAMKDATAVPEKLGVAGIKLEDHGSYGSLNVDPTRGDCLVSQEWGMHLGTAGSFSDTKHERWHFSEKEGELSVEIQHIGMVVRDVFVMSSATVKPTRIAASGDLVVWSFRTPEGDIVLLAKGAARGRLSTKPRSEDGAFLDTSSSECTYGATKIRADGVKNGGVAQLVGTRSATEDPTARATFFVDASVMKTSRDPEPVLSVRVRQND